MQTQAKQKTVKGAGGEGKRASEGNLGGDSAEWEMRIQEEQAEMRRGVPHTKEA